MGGMGRSIKSQRRAASSIFSSRSHSKKGASKLRNLDFSERNAYIRGIVRGIFHDPGRGAAIAKVAFRHHLNYKHQTSIIIAVDGMYSGQLIYAGRRAKIAIGNILPLGMLPEGTLVCIWSKQSVTGAVWFVHLVITQLLWRIILRIIFLALKCHLV